MTHAFPTRRSSDLAKFGDVLVVRAIDQLLHFLIRMADEGEQALRIDDFLGDSFGFEMALSYCEIEAFTEHRLGQRAFNVDALGRSEEHTSELQSLMRISYAVFCLKIKNKKY